MYEGFGDDVTSVVSLGSARVQQRVIGLRALPLKLSLEFICLELRGLGVFSFFFLVQGYKFLGGRFRGGV